MEFGLDPMGLVAFRSGLKSESPKMPRQPLAPAIQSIQARDFSIVTNVCTIDEGSAK